MTAKRPFLIGILQSFTPPAWLASDDRLHGGDWWDGTYYVETAQRLEAAKLDFLFFHDTLAVRRRSDGDMAPALKWAATAPAHDPLVLLPVLAHATKSIGLVGTASTTFTHPYALARSLSTMDSIAGGRIGWNVVTSFEADAATNFGLDEIPEHDDRYDRADEFMDAATALWDSWDADAVVADLDTDTYVDATKVHDVDHVGPHYRTRGPLNTRRSPQGKPLIVQAGHSSRGRDFAAKHAELVFGLAGDIDENRAFRDDIRARAEKFGRNPDDVKVMFGMNITFTPEGADPTTRVPPTDAQFFSQLEWLSASLDMDLASLPLDEPFPADLPPSGIHGMFRTFADQGREGIPLRDTIASFTKSGSGLQGTPEQVAAQLIDFVEAVDADGIMITHEWEYNAAYIDAVADGLLPALQAAGATRTSYDEGATLRRNVLGHD